MAVANDERALFKRLKRLFSTNVIVRNVGGTKLKVADTDRIQAFTSRTLYDRYARIHQQHFGFRAGQTPADSLAYQGARLQLFRDYDIMDSDAIISTALDIFADETTVQSESGESLVIESSDENIREILHNLFYDILNIEFNLWPWVRNMCKYGDFFLFLEVTEKYGIVNVLPLSVYDTIRVEGENPLNPYEVYFQTLGVQTPRDRFENFEIAHFRLLSDSNWLPYGKAQIEQCRRAWKQLQLMEDAMLVHRLVRAPDRRIFKVDVGNIPPESIDAYMERLISKMKKTPLVDPQTGDYNLKFNLQTVIEDFYLPVRGGDSGTEITNLTGLAFNAIEDVEYLRNKMIGGLKIPRAFLGYEEQIGAKATLAAEDVRFARTIERIQRIVVSELTKIATVHLYAQGYTDESLVNFNLNLTNPSTVYLQEKIALWTEKVRLAQEMQQTKLIGSEWIYEQILGLSEDEVEDQRSAVVRDAKRLFRLVSIEQGQDPANSEGTGGGQEEKVPGDELNREKEPPKAPQAPHQQKPKEPKQPKQPNLSGLSVAKEEAVDPTLAKEGRGAGRPRELDKYGTDRHPLGRDPLGNDENEKILDPDPNRTLTSRRKLSRESLELRQYVKQLKAKFPKKNLEILTEDAAPPSGTFLDKEPDEDEE